MSADMWSCGGGDYRRQFSSYLRAVVGFLSAYSTRTGTSGYTVRRTSPSRSSPRRVWVNFFCETLADRFRDVYRTIARLADTANCIAGYDADSRKLDNGRGKYCDDHD